MTPRALALLVTLTASSTAVAAARDVDLKAADGTNLRATYFAAAKPGPGIVLLHMCNSHRGAWVSLATKLAAAGFHTVTLDYRGYGDSGGTRAADTADADRPRLNNEVWPGDVDKAFDFLVAQPGVDRARIGTAGGSCGVNQAIQLARRHPEVKTAVLLAGGTNAAGEELLVRSPWMPLLGVASRDDGFAVDNMTWLLGFSSNPANQLKVYEKGGHGTELFRVHADLEPAIVAWFTEHLVKSPVKATAVAAAKPGPSVERAAELRKPGGGGRLLAQLREARKAGRPFALPPEVVVNVTGYELIQGGRVPDAIQVLELNVEAHPDSANTYDSLADAYLAAKDRPRAVEQAKKCLEVLARDKSTPEDFKKRLRESAEAKLKP